MRRFEIELVSSTFLEVKFPVKGSLVREADQLGLMVAYLFSVVKPVVVRSQVMMVVEGVE